jgi:hypothetical protein
MITETEPFVLAADGFEKTYYGIPVCASGDEGDMIALGHPGPLRVLAACNRYARKVLGLDNLGDDRTLTADDFLGGITERWGIPHAATEEEQANYGFRWVIDDATPDQPGAIAYTFVDLA